ncbi:MAG TPA: class I SAM-dependent methyltransferase [Pyrinomonadaceae bacterium]
MSDQQASHSLNLEKARGAASYPLLFRIFDALVGASSPVRKAIIWGWYQALSILDKDAVMPFMNYGYAPVDPKTPALELRPEDQAQRYFIHLYQRVAGAIDLCDKDVLEVGCGRGGGASFVIRYLGPRSVTGLDFSGRAIAFCRRHYWSDGLSFRRGDAESLPFADNSFTAVLNIESSHCYNSMERFLREVTRVLTPGGYFLFADIRRREAVPMLQEQLRESGLRILEEEYITPNVLRALSLDSERKLSLIQQSKAPRLIRRRFRHFAGLKGSRVYGKFQTGEWEYLRFVLQRL